MIKKYTQTSKNKEPNKDSPSLNGLAGLIPKSKKTLKTKDIQRLMSKLIIGFCNGSIKSDQSKTLCYLCSQYIAISQSVELEKRISEIEERLMI